MKGVLGVAAGTAVYPPFILILSPRLPCFFHPSEVWAALRPKFLSEDEWMMGAQGWGICMGSTCRQCPFLTCCFYPPLPSWTCTLLEGFRGGLPRRLPAPAPSPGCAWVSASGAQELPCLVCHTVAGCSSPSWWWQVCGERRSPVLLPSPRLLSSRSIPLSSVLVCVGLRLS